jgi:hypothetical protein
MRQPDRMLPGTQPGAMTNLGFAVRPTAKVSGEFGNPGLAHGLNNNSGVPTGTKSGDRGDLAGRGPSDSKMFSLRRSSMLVPVISTELGRLCECRNRSERSKRNVSRRVSIMYALIKAPHARGWSNR